MKFHENLSSGAKLVYADGRTDRRTDIHNEANSLFSNFPKELKNYILPLRE